MKILVLMFVSVAAVAAHNEDSEQKKVREAKIAQEKQKLVPLNREIDLWKKSSYELFAQERLSDCLERRREVDQRIRDLSSPLDLTSLNQEVDRWKKAPEGLWRSERLAEALEKVRTWTA